MAEHFFRVAYDLGGSHEHRSGLRHPTYEAAHREAGSVRKSFPTARIWIQEIQIDDAPNPACGTAAINGKAIPIVGWNVDKALDLNVIGNTDTAELKAFLSKMIDFPIASFDLIFEPPKDDPKT